MEKTSEELKASVRDAYGQIAVQSKDRNEASCCGSGGCGTIESAVMMSGENYTSMPGYNADADLGLGCGIPTQYSRIKAGHTVLDLGSGAGNDVFIARAQTGETGRVIGVDMTPAMLEKARANNAKLGHSNVEFRLGEIESLPVESGSVDVVVSNCVLNLVPDKQKAFSEIKRVLKPGGQFTISDIVLDGVLPDNLRAAAEMYAGCVSGAMQKREYLGLVVELGFENLQILKEKTISLPDDILGNYLSQEEISSFKNSGVGIKSVTVTAARPTSAVNVMDSLINEASGCCGGPAPTGVDACCVKDADAKAAGTSGCGCN